MKRYIFLLLIFPLAALTSKGQVEIRITKAGDGSIKIDYPGDMQIETGKPGSFVIRTNITEDDKLYESLSDSKIKDGRVIDYKFSYPEFRLEVYRYISKKKTEVLASEIIAVKGTKFLVKIDGVPVSRLNTNLIRPSSVIEIELVSETEDVKSLKLEEGAFLYWQENPMVYDKMEFTNFKSSLDFGAETNLKKIRKAKVLTLLLPMVSKGKKDLFPRDDLERSFIFIYTE